MFAYLKDVGVRNVKEYEANFEVNIRKELNLLCGTDDFEGITRFQLKLHPSGCDILRKGSKLLTNLSSLCLSGNTILSLRDLGTSFTGLKELTVSHCQLGSLDGIANFPNLSNLNASHNTISDLSQCTYLRKMHHLDVEGNAISDKNSLEPLALCSELESAILRGNPFSIRNHNGVISFTEKMKRFQEVLQLFKHEKISPSKIEMIENYEEIIFHLIPQLKYLDKQCHSPANDLESPSTPINEIFPKQQLFEAPFAIRNEDPVMSRNYIPMENVHEKKLSSGDTDLFPEKIVIGTDTNFPSDQSDAQPTPRKIYYGSPGRAFRLRFRTTSNISDVDVIPDK